MLFGSLLPHHPAVQLLLLLLGVFACSTAVIWIKLSAIDPVLLTGLRLAVAVVVLAPLYARDWGRHRAQLNWGHVRDSAIPGVALTLHFFTWLYGARLTSAVNSTLVVNLVPITMPFLLYWFAGERINRREITATLLAASGIGILFAADYQFRPEYFYGDAVCLGSMVLLAIYLALGRTFRHHPTVTLYLVPLYLVAASLSFACVPWLAADTTVNWRAEWLWVLLLGLVPTVLGHSLLNNAMRHFRGQIVALATMGQFIFAGAIAVWALPNETPDWSFYPASVLIVAAGYLAVRKGQVPSEDRVAPANTSRPTG